VTQSGEKKILTEIKLLRLELFGQKNGSESEHGRIPALEVKVKSHDRRISSLERLALKAVTVCGLILLLFEAYMHYVRHS
jgi:hypothetical protein